MRINIFKAWPDGYRAITVLDELVNTCGLDRTLLELVKLRVSELNGCAYCIDMHTKDAKVLGETDERLHGVAAWWETDFYSDAEQAALALAEALTQLPNRDVDNAVDDARRQFDDERLAQLVHAIAVMNVWNRLVLTAKLPPGSYQPTAPAHA